MSRNNYFGMQFEQYGISKKALTSIKYEGGQITVNGVEKTVRHKLDIGDSVKITFPPEKKRLGLITSAN